jgi:hypothetical protein
MLHNKRARALIVVVGLACAAVLAVVLVTRALATQSVASPNAVVMTIETWTSRNWTMPLNTPVFIGIGGKSHYVDVLYVAWSAVFCNGTYWNWVTQGPAGTVVKKNKYQHSGVGLTFVSFANAGVGTQNNAGGLKFHCSGDTPGPMYVYIHY